MYIYYIRPLFLQQIQHLILQVLCVGHLNIRSVYSQYEENIQMYICKFYLHIICYKKGMQSQIVFKITINKK